MNFIDINKLDEIWNSSTDLDLQKSRDLWDLRADEFNKKDNNDERSDRIKDLLELFDKKNILNKNSEVLDIGCGTGRYSIEFSKKTKNVIGLDISSKMIEKAIENIENEKIENISLNLFPWEKVDLKEMGWNKRFDLVFAAMCPGINNKDTLLKMNEASKGHCFLSGFVYRVDRVRDKINEILSKDTSSKRWGTKIICSFNILWQIGLYPKIYYKDVEFRRKRTIEDAVKIYTTYCKENPNKHNEIKDYLNSISENGMVQEETKAKIGSLIWKV